MAASGSRLCEEVVDSDAGPDEKLRAICDELKFLVRGVYQEVDGQGRIVRYNIDSCVSWMIPDMGIIDEINCALRRHSRDPELENLVRRYDDYLFMLSQRAYEGKVFIDVFD
ncbi:hypothetical protein GF386_04535 [Candidatus Pacearchaeota archaeon]|nr:hypothetical protein [Candidatus Pacearchaeota archaeon]MBD3283392.1 hypothetical protein [Candidatus Pacearchaeota archaeon]